MIRPVPHVAEMAPYALADLGGDLVSMAQNESAFPPSPRALAAARDEMAQAPLYPDPDWSELRQAIAERHMLDPNMILCGAGSMELIGCLIRAYAGPGRAVLGSAYSYAFAATASLQAQAHYRQVPEPDLAVSVDAALDNVTPDLAVVFLCNPGNPTGTMVSNADILRLRADLPGDVLLVVDQAYGEFCDAAQDPSEIFALALRGDTVVLRTFSKAYALAGARVGWGCFPPAIAGELRKLLNPNNIASASQRMAAAAMRDQVHMRAVVARTGSIREAFSERCRAMGIDVLPSHTNFVLLRFDSADRAARVDQALRRSGLLMRGMAGYGLPNCLRATICDAPVMERAATVLKEALT
ncbi:aminotransferase class I/II-fold pyridoxal phosphate-dependent enzyme [Ruegeria sp. 2012CJ41-6]|uniref:Aminotransferase class I/II-fold pyridoxal phosphate-dependent enzyme n=1 Tax=Ruegeria spongiae TaxID=2942209 RepID=A0ABT0PXQ0_9RHOB|nr:histidinol-phosphate transaminase [Ruegeria spongiae]MCL6282365.1 aminotransferase class I/II-fold pyridoxal phosphate-dependent enzyme [Ruegeria spongiae]